MGKFVRPALVVMALIASSLVALAPALGNDAKPPLGLQLFCLKNPSSCAGSGGGSVHYSGQVGQVLARVNRQVNNAIQPRAEQGDHWSDSASQGDCEDYVLAKRAALIRAGIPAGALRIAYTTTRSGEGHAILIVITDQGHLVLDNLKSQVMSVADAGYSIQRMSSGDLLRWVAYK